MLIETNREMSSYMWIYKKAKLKKDSVADDIKHKPKKPIYQASLSSAAGTKSTTVPSSTSSSCSPYSTTTSSTTNTSIMPSKESSVNEAAKDGSGLMMPRNLKIYEENARLDVDVFEPLLKSNNLADDNTV